MLPDANNDLNNVVVEEISTDYAARFKIHTKQELFRIVLHALRSLTGPTRLNRKFLFVELATYIHTHNRS